MEPNSNPPPSSSHPRPPEAAYQHWMDDAANMGLMLFRMRNDSKREGILSRGGSPQPRSGAGTPPPPPSSPPPLSPPRHHTNHPVQPPPPPNQHHHHHRPSTPKQQQHHHPDATPRTNRALQTPTVATTRSTAASSTTDSTVAGTQPLSFYLPID